MLEEKIQRKREELNKSLEKQNKYEDVYRLSVELDDLIAEFYKESEENEKKKEFFNTRKNLKKIFLSVYGNFSMIKIPLFALPQAGQQR